MTDKPAINWDSMADAASAINDWANRTFPGRGPRSSLNKLNMEEIPELLTHLKEHGTDRIGEEWADCLILLLDLAVIWKVNPAEAIQRKMEINNHRMWRKDDETGAYNHVAIDPPTPDCPGADAARALPSTTGEKSDGAAALVQEVEARGRESRGASKSVDGVVK
jgi:NTP pyrophosphatase (non-canonical NTP hydrolase)